MIKNSKLEKALGNELIEIKFRMEHVQTELENEVLFQASKTIRRIAASLLEEIPFIIEYYLISIKALYNINKKFLDKYIKAELWGNEYKIKKEHKLTAENIQQLIKDDNLDEALRLWNSIKADTIISIVEE